MANKHVMVFVLACSYNKQTDTFYIRYFILSFFCKRENYLQTKKI